MQILIKIWEFLEFLTLEVVTERLPRNFSKELALYAA